MENGDRSRCSRSWIAEAHHGYEDSIHLLEERREALADAVSLYGWIGDGIGVSPIHDALAGRTATVNGREPLSFARVKAGLDEDAVQIATYLREFDTQSTWSIMKRAEALAGKGAATREEALKQLGHRDWGG